MWDDIDFETGKIHVKRACIWLSSFMGFKGTKTGEERTIAIDAPAINLLRRVQAEQEAHIALRRNKGLSYGDENLVFCTKDGRVPNVEQPRKCFKLILKKIGITRRFRWYGVRHTHATHLLDTGVAKPKMIANRLGHSPEILFRIYGHEMEGQQLEALSKISSRVTL